MNRDNLALFQEYKDLGGRLNITDFDEIFNNEEQSLLPNVLKKEIEVLQAKDRPREELEQEFQSLGGDPDSLDDETSNGALMEEIQFLRSEKKNKDEFDGKLFAFDSTSDDGTSMADDLSRYTTLKESQIFDNVQSDRARIAENLEIIESNKVKERIGLKPDALKPLSSDLEALLEISNWNPDHKNVNEFLGNIQDKALKEQIRQEIQELVVIRNQRLDSEQREKEFKSRVMKEYELLADTKPKRLKSLGKGVYEVTTEFRKWQRRALRLQAKLANKLKALKAINEDSGESINSGYVSELYEKTKKLVGKKVI